MYKPVPFLFSLKFYVLSSFMVLTIASALSTSSVFISSPFTSFAQSHFILTVLFPFYGSTTFWTGIIEICLSFSVMVEFLSNMVHHHSYLGKKIFYHLYADQYLCSGFHP